MKWLKYTIFLVMLLPALAQAQYRGSGRPLSRQETLDSLAAKLDTSAVAAGDNVTVDWDGSSLTIASSGNGGNWSPADSTLSLDLAYYFNQNVVQITGTDDYGGWADGRWDATDGTHADETTNYLTDWQAIEMTADGTSKGIHLVKTLDLAHFSNGDTAVAADYFCWSIHITDQNRVDLGDARLRVAFCCDNEGTYTNYYKTGAIMDSTSLSAGWNHIKVSKSAFSATGSPSWGDVKGVSFHLYIAPDAEVIAVIDNIQMVRKDPDAAEPNPYQPDWTEEGNGNMAIVDESGRKRMLMLDGASDQSYIKSVKSFTDFDLSGRIIIGAGNLGYFLRWDTPVAYPFSWVQGNKLIFVISAGTSDTLTLPVSLVQGDVVDWRAWRRASSLGTGVFLDGEWHQISQDTTGFTAAKQIMPSNRQEQRHLWLGLSTVKYASTAGEALRLHGVFIQGGTVDTLFWPSTAPEDSLNYFVPDGKVKQ